MKKGRWCCANILSDPCPWALEDMCFSHKKNVKVRVCFEGAISKCSSGWNLSFHGNLEGGVKISLSAGGILAGPHLGILGCLLTRGLKTVLGN